MAQLKDAVDPLMTAMFIGPVLSPVAAAVNKSHDAVKLCAQIQSINQSINQSIISLISPNVNALDATNKEVYM